MFSSIRRKVAAILAVAVLALGFATAAAAPAGAYITPGKRCTVNTVSYTPIVYATNWVLAEVTCQSGIESDYGDFVYSTQLQVLEGGNWVAKAVGNFGDSYTIGNRSDVCGKFSRTYYLRHNNITNTWGGGSSPWNYIYC